MRVGPAITLSLAPGVEELEIRGGTYTGLLDLTGATSVTFEDDWEVTGSV